tara:strand:+ start:7490 stop:7870 length:381 start_codon:yes stop_codon:yes gene_type:complete
MIPMLLVEGKKILREIRFSLKTKNSRRALLLYQYLIPIITLKKQDIANMTIEQTKIEAQMEDIKKSINGVINEQIGKLREHAANNSDHWKTELAQRQLKETIIEHFMSPIVDIIEENTKNVSVVDT